MFQTWEDDEYWSFVESYSAQKNTSEELKDLLKMMLSDSHSERLTINEIKDHPWFTQTKATPLKESDL